MIEPIITSRLTVRPIRPSDFADVCGYALDESITMMLFYPKTYDETHDYVLRAAAEWESSAPKYLEFAAEYNGRVIGGADLDVLGNGVFEIGWELNRDFRGMGFGSEAAAAVLGYAFGTLGAERVIAHCDSRNAASEKVMKKLGMKLSDNTKTRRYRTGEISGELEYSITSDEYFK